VLSVIGGALSLPHFVHFDILHDYLTPIFAPAVGVSGAPAAHGVGLEVGLLLLGLIVALAGFGIAKFKYLPGPGDEAKPAKSGLPFVLENKWFVDELYSIFVVGPMRALAYLAGFFDRFVIDGLVNGLARFCDGLGGIIRSLQTGAIHTYGLLVIAGAVLIALSLL